MANKKEKYKLRTKIMAFAMALLLILNPVSPLIDGIVSYAARLPKIGDYGKVVLHTDAYCINGCFGNQPTDIYERVYPSELGTIQADFGFFACMSLLASQKGDADCLKALNASGLAWKPVTENDMKYFQGANGHAAEHNASQAKHAAWLNAAMADPDTYLRNAGLIGTGGGGGGGAAAPSELSSATSVSSAKDYGSGVTEISFSSSDAEFYRTVPIEMSSDGTTWTKATYTVGSDKITFSGQTAKYYRFNTAGTKYASAGGGYSSRTDLYNACYEVYMCKTCGGGHPTGGGTIDPSKHQVLINLKLMPQSGGLYFTFGGGSGGGGGGGGGGTGGSASAQMDFKTYYHAEDWTTHYNTRLTKYDYETGKKLEGATFELYERFDDYGKTSTNDGAVLLNRTSGGTYKGSYTGEPSWTDATTFRKVTEAGTLNTNTNGSISFCTEHKYHYEKTFCDGHPAPQFCEVPEPEEEEDEESGETTVTNQAEIDDAKAENQRVANQWLATVAACEAKAGELSGVHFHWIQSGVSAGEISSIAGSGGDEGTTPDAGPTDSADGDESYSSSGCQQDCTDTYDKFINMKYSYTYKEYGARTGYTIHGNHKDDIPIEAITTNSSEGGANATFAGVYSDNMTSGSLTSVPYTASVPVTASAPASTGLLGLFSASEEEKEVTVEKEAVEIDSDELLGTLYTTALNDDGSYTLTQVASPATATYSNLDTDTDDDDTDLQDTDGIEIIDDVTDKKTSSIGDGIRDVLGSITSVFSITAYAAENEETESAGEVETEAQIAVTLEEEETVAATKEEVTKETETEIKSEETAAETKTEETVSEMTVEETTAVEEEEEGWNLFGAVKNFFASLGGSLSLASAPILGGTYTSGESEVFSSEYYPTEEAGSDITPGNSGRYSHCSSHDNETSENPATNPGTVSDNTWRVYDHRFEGEIRLNKQDLNLNKAASADYDPYADANGDGTLEGAVYGLFAASDIEHPDGKTGLIFAKDELVSVTTTDRDGNATFNTITEKPGSTYNYTTGSIVEGTRAVKNLYYGYSNDDYTPDGKYTRTYPDNNKLNGNYWIGRPLIVGKYYVKELTRSEGYELSIEGKAEAYTNYGEDYNAGLPDTGEAYTTVTAELSTDMTPSMTSTGTVDHDNPAANEITFQIASYKTGGDYDILLKGLPNGSTLYRVDYAYVSKGYREEPTGAPATWVVKTDEYGTPIPKTAGAGTDIMYDGSGNPITTTTTLDEYTTQIKGVTNVDYAALAGTMTTALTSKMDSDFTSTQVATILATEIDDLSTLPAPLDTVDYKDFTKERVEKVLNSAGLSVPKDSITGKRSSYTSQQYNTGDFDNSIPGMAVRTVTFTKTDCTVQELILGIVSFYENHPYYTYGGIDSITRSGDTYTMVLYTGDSSGRYMYVSYGGDDAVIANVVNTVTDASENDHYRNVEAVYTSSGTGTFNGDTVVGKYIDLTDAGLYKATLSPQCTASYSGGIYTLTSKTVEAYQYYPEGTTPVYDASGAIVYEMEYKLPTHLVEYYGDSYIYTPLATKTDDEEKWIINVASTYTDAHGASKTDASSELTMDFLVTVPGDLSDLTHTITAEDLTVIPASKGLHVGDKLGLAFYYMYMGANVNAYPDYTGTEVAIAGSYIKTVQLDNVDQSQVVTQAEVSVLERPIRQKIKVVKKIGTAGTSARSVWYCANCGYENADGTGTCGFCSRARTSEPTRKVNYENDTYNAFHEDNIVPSGTSITDWLSKLLKGDLSSDKNYDTDIDNFRFKTYLKSNIERLYRNEAGDVTWVDQNGNEITPVYDETPGSTPNTHITWKYVSAYSNKEYDFPEVDIKSGTNAIQSANVQKIYTAVEHNTNLNKTKVTSQRANNVWNKYISPLAAGTTDAAEKAAYDTVNRTDADPISANDSLYSFVGKNTNTLTTDKLNDNANQGYTRILETKVTEEEDGTGTRNVETYNYEKFFDAMNVANTDKWDSDKLISTDSYPGEPWKDIYAKVTQDALTDKDTSFKPFGYIREKVFGDRSDYLLFPALFNGSFTEVMSAQSTESKLNAMASDAVRQFAIKWYQEDEVAKLVTANGLGEDVAASGELIYDEEIYDKALNKAIDKAYDYLEPFFNYDFDTIYAVEWDSANDGGSDKDYTTLSVDTRQVTGEHYQTSAYLPYGTYIVVEQTPGRIDSDVNDLMNKSYKVEKPKEVMVPSVYDAATTDDHAINFDTQYSYVSTKTMADMSKSSQAGGYLIRWGEEWPHTESGSAKTVIRAHSNDGDHEVYPYGLDIDNLTGSITDPGGSAYSYHGMLISQGILDPLKDYYSQAHLGHTKFTAADSTYAAIGTVGGGNSLTDKASFPLEDYTGNTATTANRGKYDLSGYRNRTYYGSIAEGYGIAPLVKKYTAAKTDNNPEGIAWEENVASMTGVLTSYEGVYAQMLEPWTVTAPADDYTYSAATFTGYADVKEENSFYSEILKVYKVDSETGELILHDNAIFALYAASRYTTQAEIDNDAALISDATAKAAFLDQFKPGDCKFYLEETEVTGSQEFLYGLGAYDVEPILTSGGDFTYSEYNTDSPLCKGKVAAGTPICLESEQIKLKDEFGNRTGQMRVFTTLNDTIMDNADSTATSYQLQNTGYFETPQPLGSGVYVLVELGRAPAGYVKIKPQPYEIYWDQTETYVGGDMFSKQVVTREKYNLITDWPYE